MEGHLTRRAFLTLLPATITQKNVAGFHLSGVIDGEHVEGGYFHLGKEFVMATPIRSPLFPLLEKLVGVDVDLTIRPR